MNYDPKFSIKQIYDQYSSSRNTTKTNPNQQFAQTMQVGGGGRNMSGIGAPRTFPKGSTYDEVPDKPEETGFTKTISNFFSSLFDSGADEDSFSNIGKVNVTPVSLYETDKFAYDPTRYTRPIDIERQDARIDNMLYNRSDDPGYKRDEYEGSTYDEVLKQIKPEKAPVSFKDSVNEAVRKGIMATTPTESYKIQDGDTLSEIAAATGSTVEELKNLNKIENENIIRAGADLKIPVQTAEQKEVVANATSMKDLATMKNYKPTQSGVPMDQRIFEPELGEDMENVVGYDDVPQMVTDMPEQTGIMSRTYNTVEAAQQRLNDLGYTTLVGPLAVDGDLGPGTARQLRKFQATAGIPITGELDEATQKELKKNSNRNKEGKDPSAKLTTLSEGLFQQIKKPIAQIESGGESEPYAAIGGDADDYDGKYQFGWRAKQDLRNNPNITEEERAKLFHEEDDFNEDDPSRVAFRADPNLQEKAFRLYVNQNHDTLTRNSQKYRDMDDKNKLAVLGYAHNQGAEAALEWLTTAVVGTDAFNTRGDEYSEAIKEELSRKKKGR